MKALLRSFIVPVAAALCLASSPTGAQPGAQAGATSSVQQLDLKQFAGTWYEVLRLPLKSQKKCVQESTELYALGDKAGSFSIVTTCPNRDGFTDVHNFDGKQEKKGVTDGRLKLRTIFPFYSHYAVLALAPDYQWAVLGTRKHKKVWVLSRTAAPDAASMTELKAKAAAIGADVSKLIAPAASK